MKCECRKRMAILTCIACQKILCSYCIQFGDHNCAQVETKLSKDRTLLTERLEKYATKPTKRLEL